MPKADGSERPLHEPVPDRTVVAMVCADCQIMAGTFAQDSTLRCVCPGYSKAQVYFCYLLFVKKSSIVF